jgi:hypothetical protein
VRYSKCPKCGFDLKYQGVFAEVRTKHPKAFHIWEVEDDVKLTEMSRQAKSVLEMSQTLGRQPSAINKRLQLLGIEIAKTPPPDTTQWPTEDEQIASLRHPAQPRLDKGVE